MKKINHGFTLIELMIVVAIIGILAAVSIPAYQDYVVRTQVSEGLNILNGLKPKLVDYYADNGTFTGARNSQDDFPPTTPGGKYVKEIWVWNNLLQVVMGNDSNIQINNNRLTIQAVPNAGSIEWVCIASGNIDVPNKYRPKACRL